MAEANKIIQINHTATADSIQGKEFSRYGFRVITNQYSIIAALAHVLATKPYQRYYILNQDYALGRDSAATFKAVVEEPASKRDYCRRGLPSTRDKRLCSVH